MFLFIYSGVNTSQSPSLFSSFFALLLGGGEENLSELEFLICNRQRDTVTINSTIEIK